MMKHAEITEKVSSAYYHVYNTLGHGFLERVYQNAMVIELRKRGVQVVPQARLDVRYEGEVGGEYFADPLVEAALIVELKAGDGLAAEHHAQVINYLKASGIEVGLLFNFGPKTEFKQKVWDHGLSRELLPV
jgi:GxxExxY protein